MIFIYSKLQPYDYADGHFPFEIVGYFNDGVQSTPIWQQFREAIVFTIESFLIRDADLAFLAASGLKKFPADVVVSLRRTGGDA